MGLEEGGDTPVGDPVPDLNTPVLGTAGEELMNHSGSRPRRPHLTKCLPQFDQLREVMAAVCWWWGTALTKHWAVFVS